MTNVHFEWAPMMQSSITVNVKFFIYITFAKRFLFSPDRSVNVTEVNVDRRSNSMEITWDKLKLGVCIPIYQFILQFKNGSTSIINFTANNTAFVYYSICAKVTMLEIWAVVNGDSWTTTKFPVKSRTSWVIIAIYFCQVVLFYFMRVLLLSKNEN